MKERLIAIYNRLISISVKGEDVVPMAECLINLQNLIDTYQEPVAEETKEEN